MSRSGAQPRKAWPFLPAMLRVSAIVELATGCALLATPSVVLQALIGSPSNQVGWIVARILGGALLALGVAGMLARGGSPERGMALAFIVYDTSTAVVLAWAGAAGAADGWLLWPVVGLHAILAAALAVGQGLWPGQTASGLRSGEPRPPTAPPGWRDRATPSQTDHKALHQAQTAGSQARHIES